MEALGKKVDLEFITNLHKEFIEALGKIKEEASIKRLSAALQISKTYSKLLREYVIEKKFESTDDEINFFKQQKPKFLTHLFFYSAVYQIEISKPTGAQQLHKEYYQTELEKTRIEFDKNKGFYSYLRSGATHLDAFYFIRDNQNSIPTGNLFEEMDPGYSTGYDFLVAVYWANEKLSGYLNKKLTDSAKPLIPFDTPAEVPKVVWTDSKTALIELVYAFKAKGSFNNGRATLKDITDYIQQIFGIELSNPTRDFQEILRRKTGYTNYIDGLKESYLQYIDKIETRDRR